MEVKRHHKTESLIIIGGIPTSCSGVLVFPTRRGPRLIGLRYSVAFPSPSKQMPGYITTSFHNFSKSLFS